MYLKFVKVKHRRAQQFDKGVKGETTGEKSYFGIKIGILKGKKF